MKSVMIGILIIPVFILEIIAVTATLGFYLGMTEELLTSKLIDKL